MSCNMALRRSPKPGALTAATLTIPRMLLTTKVAKASPSTSSATINNGRPAFATASSTGSNSRMLEIFLRSEEHTSELQSRPHLVCRLLLEKKKTTQLNLAQKYSTFSPPTFFPCVPCLAPTTPPRAPLYSRAPTPLFHTVSTSILSTNLHHL